MKKRTTMLALLLATGAGTCLQAQEKINPIQGARCHYSTHPDYE